MSVQRCRYFRGKEINKIVHYNCVSDADRDRGIYNNHAYIKEFSTQSDKGEKIPVSIKFMTGKEYDDIKHHVSFISRNNDHSHPTTTLEMYCRDEKYAWNCIDPNYPILDKEILKDTDYPIQDGNYIIFLWFLVH